MEPIYNSMKLLNSFFQSQVRCNIIIIIIQPLCFIIVIGSFVSFGHYRCEYYYPEFVVQHWKLVLLRQK